MGQARSEDDRRLTLRRETLHDLEPADGQTALIRGGECAQEDASRVVKWMDEQLGWPVPIPTTRFEALLGRAGQYTVQTVIQADFTVTDEGQIVIDSLHHSFKEAERRDVG